MSEEVRDDDADAAGQPPEARHRRHRYPARTKAVFVRLGEDEYGAVARAADAVGVTPTTYVGMAALAAARETIPPVASPSREALVEVMRARTQVAKFGTNVNQAVAALNATGEAPAWLQDAVRLAAAAVRRLDESAQDLARRLEQRR